jgi:hypothetical protein
LLEGLELAWALLGCAREYNLEVNIMWRVRALPVGVGVMLWAVSGSAWADTLDFNDGVLPPMVVGGQIVDGSNFDPPIPAPMVLGPLPDPLDKYLYLMATSRGPAEFKFTPGLLPGTLFQYRILSPEQGVGTWKVSANGMDVLLMAVPPLSLVMDESGALYSSESGWMNFDSFMLPGLNPGDEVTIRVESLGGAAGLLIDNVNVPEPASLGIVGLGIVLAMRRRRLLSTLS